MNNDFKQIQHELAAWLRSDGRHDTNFAQIEARRLAIYRRLIRNNVQQFLEAGFPVLQQVLRQRQWQFLVDTFMARHHAQSPMFSDIGAEFVDFLATFDVAQLEAEDLPLWLFELAHYERLEVDVQHASFDDSLSKIVTLTDATMLYVNTTAVLAIYRYPVAHISQSQQPQAPLAEACCMLVYRKPDDEQVSFMQVNALTALVVEELQRGPVTFSQLFEALQVQVTEYDPETLAQGLLSMIQDFCERFVLFTKA